MSRSELRAEAWEMSGGRCEHPILVSGVRKQCPLPGVELAHIVPRGMGHKGARDFLDNVMCACGIHARTTDDLSSEAWEAVPNQDRLGLAEWVRSLRHSQGFVTGVTDED